MDFIADILKRTLSERQSEEGLTDKDSSFGRAPFLFSGSGDCENILKNGLDFASALSLPQTTIQGLLQGSESHFLHSSTNSSFTDPDSVQKANAHVLELQNKLVCLQQQLNAAITANYTKNIMIEQLDKVLARIMEGWKKYEAEKSERILELEKECNDTKGTLENEQKVIVKVEEELGRTLEKLMLCQKEILAAQEERHRLAAAHQAEMNRLEERFRAEKTQLQQVISKLEDTVHDQVEVISVLKDQIRMEQENRQLSETEKNNSLDRTNEEVHKLQQDLNKYRQIEKTLVEHVQQLKLEMEDTLREKDSLKVELNIALDRVEVEKSALETKLKQEFADVIKDLDTRLDQVHEKLTSDHADELQKAHAEHLHAVEAEIQKSINLEAKLREEFQMQLRENDDGFKAKLSKALNEKEARLQELSAKLLQLQQRNDMLASGRSQLMSKFQELLQSQWQEALGILYGKVDPASMLNLDYRLPLGYMAESLQHEFGYLRNNAMELAAQIQPNDFSPRRERRHTCCGFSDCRNGLRTCISNHPLQITPRKERPGNNSHHCHQQLQRSPNITGGFLFDVNHCSPLSVRNEVTCYHQCPKKPMSPLAALQLPRTNIPKFDQVWPRKESSSSVFEWLSNQQHSQKNVEPNCPFGEKCDNIVELPKLDTKRVAQPACQVTVSQASSLDRNCPFAVNASTNDRHRISSNSFVEQQLFKKNLFCDSGFSENENRHLRFSGTKPSLPMPDVSAIGGVSKTYNVGSSKTSGSTRTNCMPSSVECSRTSSDAEEQANQRKFAAEEKSRLNRRCPFSTPMHEYGEGNNRKKQLHAYLEKLLQKPPRNVNESLDVEPCRDVGKKEHSTCARDQCYTSSAQKIRSMYRNTDSN